MQFKTLRMMCMYKKHCKVSIELIAESQGKKKARKT